MDTSTNKKPLVIIATGGNWKDETYDAFRDLNMSPFDVDIMTVNYATIMLPCKIQHAVSAHGWLIHRLIKAREVLGCSPCNPFVHSINKGPGITHFHTNVPLKGGSSGLLALYIARLQGYVRILLIGINLTGHYQKYKKYWGELAPTYEPYVRGASEYTSGLFGIVNREWLFTYSEPIGRENCIPMRAMTCQRFDHSIAVNAWSQQGKLPSMAAMKEFKYFQKKCLV